MSVGGVLNQVLHPSCCLYGLQVCFHLFAWVCMTQHYLYVVPLPLLAVVVVVAAAVVVVAAVVAELAKVLLGLLVMRRVGWGMMWWLWGVWKWTK